MPRFMQQQQQQQQQSNSKYDLLSVDTNLQTDIKIGERTAFIPMTCQEKLILDKLEAGLISAAGVWRDSAQQLDHENLMQSAMQHWKSDGNEKIDKSWIWEVGRWNSDFSLPFAIELRRVQPNLMRDMDQVLAAATCLKNRKILLAQKLQQQQLNEQQQQQQQQPQEQQQQQQPSENQEFKKSASSSQSSKKKESRRVQRKQKVRSLEDLEDESACLCQVRWGFAPDSEAAKRRQLEKLENEKLMDKVMAKQQQQQQQQHTSPVIAASAAAASGPRRAIVKTSHLRHEDFELNADDTRSSGYASHDNSPRQPCNAAAAAAGRINDLLLVDTGSRWID